MRTIFLVNICFSPSQFFFKRALGIPCTGHRARHPIFVVAAAYFSVRARQTQSCPCTKHIKWRLGWAILDLFLSFFPGSQRLDSVTTGTGD